MRSSVKRSRAKKIALSFLALAGAWVLFILFFVLGCTFVQPPFSAKPKASKEQGNTATDIGTNRRPEEDTYFTYPEWYIVYSYQERADFLERNLPSGFPHFGSIAQYWRGYCFVCGLTHSRHEFNAGDHVMLLVIGSSFSVEYAIRGAYEGSVGKLSEWSSSHQAVEEDAYAYRVARDYADFVNIRPFYEFSFARRLQGLWKETSLWGPHPARKWERKAILSLDYGLEAVYAWVLEKGSHAVYGVEPSDTYAWIENAPDSVWQENPRIRKVKEVGARSYIAVFPRYQEFTQLAVKLARQDVHFVEVAGNNEILVTAITPQDWKYDLKEADFLFATDMLTQPNMKRIAAECPVSSLHLVLNGLGGRGFKVEHVYDY
ncbi:MAG: hypothetical protein WAR21_09955 [Candidatus Acidiferrales bacterium]